MRIRLKASNGQYVSYHAADADHTIRADRENVEEAEEFDLYLTDYTRVRTGDRASLRTGNFVADGTGFQVFRGDLYVTTVDSRGRQPGFLYVNTRFWGARDSFFEIVRLDDGGGALGDGDRIALHYPQGWLSLAGPGGGLRIVEKDGPEENETFVIETMATLKLFWDDGQNDHFSTATYAGERDALRFDYAPMRAQGRIFMNDGPGRKPLFLFWHGARRDNLLATAGEGERDALEEGYVKARLEGYVLEEPEYGSIPLRTYFRGLPRNDYFTTTSISEERAAGDAGYIFIRDEGYIFPIPAGILSTTPPDAEIPVASGESAGTWDMPRLETDLVDPAVGLVDPATGGATSDSNDLAERPAATGAMPGIEANIEDVTPGSDILGDAEPADPNFRLPGRRRRGRRGQPDKVALVLSGGGAKGCFEVGAVKRLWEEGFRPDIITGVSVGALNGAKLAEGLPGSANALETIWEQLDPLNSGGRAVYLKDYYFNLLKTWVEHLAFSDSPDDALWAWLGGGDPLNPVAQRVKFAAAHLHAVHSMDPLRRLVSRELDLDAIRASGIELRIGITDMGTGRYFSVTEPFPDSAPGGLPFCGRIEVEPDHRRGPTWLSRPIFGADAYAMSIEDAIYASLVQPVWMEPKILNLRDAVPTRFENERIASLFTGDTSGGFSTYLPPALLRILNLTGFGSRDVTGDDLSRAFSQFDPAASPFDLEQIDTESFNSIRGDSRFAQRHLYDGGLRDTMAIRTAMRLGAREIIVITGERLQAQTWNFTNPARLEDDLTAVPALQYGLGLLQLWFNEAARTDMLLAIAQNEFLGWLYRCFALLDHDQRQQIAEEFNTYWAAHGKALFRELGGSSWLGGYSGFHVPPPGSGITPRESAATAYGVPFQDEGCRISYIAPDQELVDSLAFDNWDEIRKGIDLGYEAARNPVELSFPVPDDRQQD